ncbi:HD domain-containing protein [Clostridium sp. YIM B02515]|uniref:HD domain-containing protein n=1 Tax=Clostridium rhizosphaerae TaxID=2803861 RepID=A0ABS1TDD1_9CLOT|nr:HD domain-containing protein [Clostridium rhizosphaerae]MBL4937359.1 HD domain-containing protein [Clostridium rhizosphaerae]
MKGNFVKDIKNDEYIEGSFMIMKRLFNEGKRLEAYIGDKTGDVKVCIQNSDNLKVGDVIYIKASNNNGFQVREYKKKTNYDLNDFLPAISKPIDEIMEEMQDMSEEEFKSEECKTLNDYFFSNKDFVESFKRGIGGLNQHHNYIGGLAEHTLNVMYMTKTMAYRYDCLHKDIAILAAKLHDIGKTVEYNVEGPFSVSMRGEMEGHIVIGITMLEEAFNAGGKIYSEDFKNRIRGCVVQHHGKVEYGSPKVPNTEEAYIVHYADFIDATMNKVGQIRDGVEPGSWTEYDRRIGTKLYI